MIRRLPKRLRYLLSDFISLLLVTLLRLWSASWRKDDTALKRVDFLIEQGEKLLFVFWHGNYLPLFPLLEGRDVMVFSSQSFRGEIIEKICHRFGYSSVQIPQHKPGGAYTFVRDNLQKHHAGALALDGPLGPYHNVKSGALRLAFDLGYLLVPISVASNPTLILNYRWDKREIPYPFARLAIAIGEPVHINDGLQNIDLAEWKAKLGTMMETTHRQADQNLENKSL